MGKIEDRISHLLAKYHDNDLNDEEKSELEAWFSSLNFNEIEQLKENEFLEPKFYQEHYQDILKRASYKKQKAKLVYLRKLSIAASVLLFILGGIVWMKIGNYKVHQTIVQTEKKSGNLNDILPGHQGAILELSNGQKLILDSVGNGQIAVQGNAAIANEDGRLSYKLIGKTNEVNLINTLITPAGRVYQLTLPDETKVWLNASSSISYPTSFPDDLRKVKIKGEAYFEVTKSYRKDGTRKPFVVEIINSLGISHKVNLEVLGTTFNVNAYDDEEDIKTTLLEGKVNVRTFNTETLLTPGNQVVVRTHGQPQLVSVSNFDQFVAWKNGYFYFDHASVQSIIRQFNRWYNLDIIAPNSVSQRTFSGKISRNTKLIDVLKLMDMSAIQYSIKDKKVIIENTNQN